MTELWGLTRRIRLAIWELFERALYIAAFIVFERGLFFVLRFGVADAPKDLHVWFDGLLGVASVASAVTATGLFFIEYARVLWHFYRMDGGTDEDEA